LARLEWQLQPSLQGRGAIEPKRAEHDRNCEGVGEVELEPIEGLCGKRRIEHSARWALPEADRGRPLGRQHAARLQGSEGYGAGQNAAARDSGRRWHHHDRRTIFRLACPAHRRAEGVIFLLPSATCVL
jgi:hypothetical protein